MIEVATGFRTDVGRVRDHNEDAALVGRHLWVVADGMGGHAAGDVAAGLVIEGLKPLEGRSSLRPADLVAALHVTNDRILEYGSSHPNGRGLGSTVTGVAAVQVAGGVQWAIFNIGDSRVYRLFDGVLTRATIDHSEVEELVLEGVITREQARTHRARNVVTRSLGQQSTPQVDLWLLPPTPGERFLICSDGLSGELEDELMRDILLATPDPQAAAESLVETALASGGRDNVTAIVVAPEVSA